MNINRIFQTHLSVLVELCEREEQARRESALLTFLSSNEAFHFDSYDEIPIRLVVSLGRIIQIFLAFIVFRVNENSE